MSEQDTDYALDPGQLLLVLEAAEQLAIDRDESIRDEYPEDSDEFTEVIEKLQRLDDAIAAVHTFARTLNANIDSSRNENG